MENPVLTGETNIQRVPKLGLTAFILSLTPFVLFCLTSIMFFSTTENYRYSLWAVVGELFACLGVLAPLAGMVLGILSLVRKEPKKGFAIAAIPLGILTAVGMGFLAWINLLVAFSAM